MDCSLLRSSAHGDSPGKNTGVGCHALLHEIILTRGANRQLLGLLPWQAVSFTASATRDALIYGTLCIKASPLYN